MKKYFFIALSLLLTTSAFAQRKVTPTPEQVARVTRTTTNVVLTGDNMLLETALRKAVEKNWKLTPVTFIDTAEFNKNMGDANRLFLLIVDGKFKKDKSQSNYVFLNLLMGGALEVDKLADFILLPLVGDGQDEDMAMLFMDAYIDIVQQHLRKLQASPKLAKSDLDIYNDAIGQLQNRQILLRPADIAYSYTEGELATLFNGHLSLATEKEIEHAVETQAANTVACLAFYPEGENVTGAYCYNLLIACDTHELMYFKRHKITGANQKGFLKEEIKRISIPFKK